MLSDKQNQEQSQFINFAEKHGIIDSAFCEYFTSKSVESLNRYLGYGTTDAATKAVEEMRNSKTVKFLVYEGKTVKIICHLYNKGQCVSPLNEKEDKACILI